MDINFFSNKEYQKYLIFIFLYGSLIIGYVFNENALGNSINDYSAHKIISQKFSANFFSTLFSFDIEGIRHSPLLLIILSFFEKL